MVARLWKLLSFGFSDESLGLGPPEALRYDSVQSTERARLPGASGAGRGLQWLCVGMRLN